METLIIKPGHLTLKDLRKVYEKPVKITLQKSAYKSIKESLNFITTVVEENRTTYGVNTGIGILASKRIGRNDLEILQKNIVLSHVTGVGPPAEDGLVRLIIVLKVNSLALGFSGVRPELLEALMTLVNEEVYPCIPIKGSVGASGDLAPLSHMAALLLGEGKANYKGRILNAKDALNKAGLSPMTLGPKEGVALINGTQVSTAFALKGLFKAEDMLASAIVLGSLSLDAVMGSRKPFDAKIQNIKGHSGQISVTAVYRHLLQDKSEISESHRVCCKVQDPYSIRCQPQVMGACLDQLINAANVLLTEANASSDNPVVFASDNEVISAGNFHAEYVAFAADNLALVLAEIGSMSERRTSLLMDKKMSSLPEFLVKNSGVNSGYMTAQVTAAALVSENKCLAHPASVDTIPTSANQEDHVSMAPIGGKRLWDMAENLKHILAIEWLCACQGLDLRKLKSSPLLEKARMILRGKVTFLEEDRFLATDIEAASSLIEQKVLNTLIPEGLIPSWKKEQNGFSHGVSNGSAEKTNWAAKPATNGWGAKSLINIHGDGNLNGD